MKFSKSKLFSLCVAALSCSSTLISTGNAGDVNLSSPTLTLAPSDREALNDALWTGPLLAPSAGCLPKGHIGVSSYFIDGITNNRFDNSWSIRGRKGSLQHSFLNASPIAYGLTDYLEVAVTPQFGYNLRDTRHHSSSLKVADTTAKLQVALMKYHEGSWKPNLVFAVGEVFPTGNYDNLDLRPSDGFGTGAYQTYIDLCAQEYFWMPTGRILSARLGVIYNFVQDDVRITNGSTYGTTKGFRGHADPGNTFTTILGLEYSLTRHWVPALDVLYAHGDSTNVSGTQTTHFDNGMFVQPVHFDSPSGELFAVAPALEYNWNENWGVIGGAQINFAGRNTSMTVAPQIAVSISY